MKIYHFQESLLGFGKMDVPVEDSNYWRLWKYEDRGFSITNREAHVQYHTECKLNRGTQKYLKKLSARDEEDWKVEEKIRQSKRSAIAQEELKAQEKIRQKSHIDDITNWCACQSTTAIVVPPLPQPKLPQQQLPLTKRASARRGASTRSNPQLQWWCHHNPLPPTTTTVTDWIRTDMTSSARPMTRSGAQRLSFVRSWSNLHDHTFTLLNVLTMYNVNNSMVCSERLGSALPSVQKAHRGWIPDNLVCVLAYKYVSCLMLCDLEAIS